MFDKISEFKQTNQFKNHIDLLKNVNYH